MLLLCATGREARGQSPKLTAVTINGEIIDGTWAGCTEESVRISSGDGLQTIAIDELDSVSFVSPERMASGDVDVLLADGGSFRGIILEDAPPGVLQTVPGSLATTWPIGLGVSFSALRGIRLTSAELFPEAEELFAAALAERRPGEDALVTREREDPRVLHGTLQSVSPRHGVFRFAGEDRTFRLDKIYGIVFAAGATVPPRQQVEVQLTDGSTFSGALSVSGDTVTLDASFGSAVSVPVMYIQRLRVFSSRVVYLSDLEPQSQQTEGRLHAPWPVRIDRNVAGGTLSLGGIAYERGLGVHSRTELQYDLGGQFERFTATVGIDDAMRPGGSVLFEVRGDGRVLYSSGTITGAEPPQQIRVDVAGVNELTLLTDYGDGLDLGDQADWAQARLIRPQEADRP